VDGSWARDVGGFLGGEGVELLFGSVLKASSGMSVIHADGVLGLAWQSPYESGNSHHRELPWVKLARGQVPALAASFSFEFYASGGGLFSLGGSVANGDDSTSKKGGISSLLPTRQAIPLKAPRGDKAYPYWSVEASYGVVGVPSSVSGLHALIDTGTSGIGIPTRDLAGLVKNLLGKGEETKCKVNDGGSLVLCNACDKKTKWGALELSLRVNSSHVASFLLEENLTDPLANTLNLSHFGRQKTT